MSYDIVYILKDDVKSDELRYSLRSVCQNFDYNKIWFYCGCPRDIQPDFYVPFKQKGTNKLERVRSTYTAICDNNEITDKFWLFNDDFFILQPYDQEIPKVNGTLDYVAYQIVQRNNKESYYTYLLKYTADVLRRKGYDTLSYACHVPMLFDRAKVKEVLNEFPIEATFRSVYGNYTQMGGELFEDVKIVKLDQIPDIDWKLLSTHEDSFANGEVGKFIRFRFPKKCKYEL